MDLSDGQEDAGDGGDETISLSDVLVARDSCLPEDELWALCRECCLVLEVVNNSPDQFQTLCVTPDTVAFDQMGNVCFLDLDVDPDPIYLPPEYSSNGNPYKAHLFSLGMTLLYAAEYNVDHSKEKITPELHDLLGRMTADSTTLRPDLESTIILCEEQLCGQSSQEVCCGIAAVAGFGLPQEDYITVESMYWKGTNLSNFYDVSSSSDENPSEATNHFDENVVSGSYATEVDEFSQLESYANSDLGDTTCCDDIPDITEDISQAESLPWSDEGSVLVTGTFESPNDSIVTNEDSTMEKRRHRKVSPQTGTSSWGLNEGTLKQKDGNNEGNEAKKPKPALPKKPDSIPNLGNSKVSVSELPKGAVSDLIVSELLSESDTDQSRVDSDKNVSETKTSLTSGSTSKSNMSDKTESRTKTKERNGSSSSGKDVTVDKNQNVPKSVKSDMDVKGQTESMQKPSKSNGIEEKKATDTSKPCADTTALKNKRNKRKQGLTVTDILDSLDRNLTEEEMWALCKEGTAALQRKKKHLPAYLSPDTLLIRESGNVSFKAIPEEKPLEVIFMAPELQSKGELSEKTCLYGLSVTLRCAAGKKYSPFSSLSVSQDLKELLTFLADSNPAKRPELTDISKVCAQHSNGTSSDTVCANILQEAFAALNDIEEKVSNNIKEETPPNPPSVEQTPATSIDTNNSGLAKPSAFKPMAGSGGFQPIKPAPIGTNIGGAFCPVPKKLPEIPEPRIPSAFSSPATHFKPIILQQTEKPTNEKLGSLKEEDKKPKEKNREKPKSSASKEKVVSPKKSSPVSDNPNDSDKEVVKKLKELKKNLMKHRQPTMAKEIENEEKLNDSSTTKSTKSSSSSSRRSLPSTHKSKSEKSEKSEKQGASKDALESLLKEIQKQGNAPDTQILASTIAQYLKGQMGPASEGQEHSALETKSENPDTSVELDMTVTSGQVQLTQGQILPNLPSQLHSQLLGQTMSLPLNQYGGNVITGLPQFQFQQDPVTGFLQLTPVVPIRPMSVHSNSGSGRSNSGVDFTSPFGTSSVVRDGPSPHMSPKSIHNQSDVSNASAISDPTGSKPKGLHGRTAKDLVQKTANLRAKNMSRPSPLHDSMGIKDNGSMSKWKSDHALNSSTDLSFFTGDDQTRHKSSSSLSNKLPTGYMYDDTYVGSLRRPNPAIQMPNGQFTNGVSNNRLPDNYRVRTHSNSSSPSPSKDSGVSGMNVIGGKSHPNADVSLMDRLLNSNVNGKQQRTLGKIVHLLREEFAFDGYMENGVEDLAMAEYIASLGVLKWETFTSAISEKYCDLYWGTDLLANLYSAVNGTRPSSASKLNTKKPPMPKKSPQRPNEDEDSSLSENNDHSRERTHNRLQPDIPGTRRPHSSFNPRNKLQDTSDSTDNEHYEKRRKKKSKHELDKMKSSSSNNLLEGSGVFVPSLNVPQNADSIMVVKALEENGDSYNGNHISDSQTHTLSLPQNNNPLFNRQTSMDSALNNRTTSSLPNTLSASFDGGRHTGVPHGRSGHGKTNGVTGLAVGHVTDANGLKREVSMSSHSSSQSDALRDSEALPVDKKGHVVYHWAMIQLCMNPEMERFMQDIDEENSQMLLGKLSALDQQLKMERRLRKKTQRYYRNLVDQSKNPLEIGKPDKTTKAERTQLSQAAKDISEMTQRIRFIDLCKTHIQGKTMLLAELQGIDVSYLFSIAVCPAEEPLQLHPRPDNPLLQFQNLREAQTGCEIQALHAGTPEGLMAYLFASTALSEGFIHQFFFCYRYFTTASDVLQFLVSRYISATQAGSTETNISRLQQRVIDLLHFWIEGYYSIDFHGRAPLVTYLTNFIKDHIKEESERGQSLIALLSNCCSGNHLELSSADPEESEMHFWQKEGTKLKQNEKSEKKSEWDSFKSLVRGKSSAKDKAGKVKISAVVVERRRRSAGSQEILPMTSMSRRNDSFMLADYTSLCLAEQLCLIEQGIFQLTHPVHYLDSKSRGVGVALTMKGMRTPAVTRRSMFEESSSLFIEAILDSSAIQKMIDHSEEVSHWVSAEIVSASNNKTQVTVLSKFIFIAHTCVELRNYATAMAILDGLENLIIKQLPAWKHLPAKCTSVMEQLEATRMLLKNDPLSLMQQGKECYLYPTIPCAVLFLLHIQQSEIGGFKLANQMYKWGKIRSIAQVIDQIRVFREHIYGFEADHQVQDTLRQRISEMSSQDITTIASQNEMNFQKVSSGSGISGAFKKMRGKLK